MQRQDEMARLRLATNTYTKILELFNYHGISVNIKSAAELNQFIKSQIKLNPDDVFKKFNMVIESVKSLQLKSEQVASYIIKEVNLLMAEEMKPSVYLREAIHQNSLFIKSKLLEVDRSLYSIAEETEEKEDDIRSLSI